jgi:outer membrane biosynthesis protein TonB
LILWNLRDTVDETASKSDQKIAHKMIGSRIGRSGQACRIQLCSMKKNVKLLNLAYALQAPSSPQTEEAAKQAEPQPEKKPSEKAKVQPKKRPSAKARARATKKPSVKVEAQPQKPLPTFSPSRVALTPSPAAFTPSPVAFTPSPVTSSPVSVQQGSDADGCIQRWRGHTGYRDVSADSTSEPPFPREEVW